MRTLLRFSLLLAGCAILFAQPSRVVINEVLFAPDPANTDPLRTCQWVELFNPTPDPVDLAGYTITGRAGIDGPSSRKLPSISLPPGAYLVIHFTNGIDRLDFADGTGDFYAGASDTPFWDELLDTAALFSPDSISDFVAWSSGSKPYQGGTAHDQAVEAKLWSKDQSLNANTISHSLGEQVRVLLRGESIGRDGLSSDSDTPADFDAHGGRHAIDPTPGRFNGAPQPYQPSEDSAALSSPLGKSPVRAAESPKTRKWTVMLYFGGDNNLGATLFQQLTEISLAGGSTDDVNYVTYADIDGIFQIIDPRTQNRAQTRIHTTVRGLISSSSAADRRFVVPQGEQSELGQRNSADPDELRAFIEWTKKFYPAERYALIINSHGNGWKGVVQDASVPGSRENSDRLYMGELKKALKGHEFELIAFHACMMASIEVAAQIKDNASYMVASEELIVTQAFPYYAAARSLNARPEQAGKDLGLVIVDEVKQNYVNLVPRLLDSAEGVKFWTISLIDLKKMDTLLTAVDNWAKELLSSMSWLATRNLLEDNAQMRVKVQAEAATRFADDNFMDLDDFARRVQADAGIPSCAKKSIPALLSALETQVVVKHLRSDAYANTYL